MPMKGVRDFPRDRVLPPKSECKIRPSWAVNSGLVAATLCFHPQRHGEHIDLAPFGGVCQLCIFALPYLEGFLKGYNE